MAVKARDDVTLAALSDVSNVRRYYLMQSSTLNPPPAPTTNPAPSPWSTVEPTYTEGSTTTLYTVDLTVFSDGTFDYSPVSKSAAFEASKKAYNKALSAVGTANAALAAVPPFIQAGTPSAAVVGQLWFPLDANGRVIGMKRANATGTSGWVDYLAMAGKILVPGSVGTTEIGPDGVTAANIQASNALWAKLASFAKVTTDMLVAGNATITGEMIVNELIGKVLRGGLFEAGGGSLPMVRIGPLSGQIGTGDSYGVAVTTPNGNAQGSAVLGVSPAGPWVSFMGADGAEKFYADANGVLRITAPNGQVTNLQDAVFGFASYSWEGSYDLLTPAGTSGGYWNHPVTDEIKVTNGQVYLFQSCTVYLRNNKSSLTVETLLVNLDTGATWGNWLKDTINTGMAGELQNFSGTKGKMIKGIPNGRYGIMMRARVVAAANANSLAGVQTMTAFAMPK